MMESMTGRVGGGRLRHGKRNGACGGIGDPNGAQLVIAGEDTGCTLAKHGASGAGSEGGVKGERGHERKEMEGGKGLHAVRFLAGSSKCVG
jgi:hypothetical protein